MVRHDERHALALAVDIVNSAPETAGIERLVDVGDLAELAHANDIEPRELGPPDLDAVRALRGRLLEVFETTQVEKTLE